MMVDPYSGPGGRAWRRQSKALAARCKANGIGCATCGKPFDWANPNGGQGFTADHPHALNAGGRLLGQQLVPMHRSCNARKGDTVTPTLRPPS